MAEENILTVEMPLELVDDSTIDRLRKIVENKGELFKAAFKTDSLDIIVDEDKVCFPWFTVEEYDDTNAYCTFISMLCEFAKNQSRINNKPETTDNPKYTMRWRCVTRVENGPSACDAETIRETELQSAVVKAINYALGDKAEMLKTLQNNIELVLKEEEENSTESIDARLRELQQELLKRANSNKSYDDLANEIDSLRKEKQNAAVDKAEREGVKKRIADMKYFLDSQKGEIEEYDEQLVRKMIEKIIVYDDRFAFEFKSGTSVDVERDRRKNFIAP